MKDQVLRIIINIFALPFVLIASIIMGIFTTGMAVFYGGWIPVLISIIIAAIYAHGIPGLLFWKGLGVALAILVAVFIAYYFISIVKGLFTPKSGTLGEAETKSASEEFSEKIGNIFAGLSPQAARKRYADLIKAYHPDNGGNAEKAQKIIDDYREYRDNL